MRGISNAMSTQFKADTVSGMQSSGQTCTITASATSGATSSKSVSDMTGLAAGMAISGTNVAAGSVIATADSTISATSSKVTTGAISGGTITVASDQYYLLLNKTNPAGTSDATAINNGTPVLVRSPR